MGGKPKPDRQGIFLNHNRTTYVKSDNEWVEIGGMNDMVLLRWHEARKLAEFIERNDKK